MTGFKITGNKGFHITFSNGVTVSVQFGVGNYCQHHNNSFDLMGTKKDNYRWESLDAEIAIWLRNGNWITREFKDNGDNVLGWQSSEQVLEALNWAKNHTEIRGSKNV